MARPRESLLNLFDPLACAEQVSASGARDSPDLSSSDKENSSPPTIKNTGVNPALTMTKFFDRSYHRPSYKSKPLPAGALIDFDISVLGDVDGSMSDGEGIDTDIEDVGSPENALDIKATNTPRRRILADITAVDDVRVVPFNLLEATPLGPKQSSQRSHPATAPPLPALVTSSQPASPANLPGPAESLLAPPSIPLLPSAFDPSSRPTSPPNALPVSRHDRRDSIDLHSSFHLHLRDNSFDLLNDRISFIGCDSMIGGSESLSYDIQVNTQPQPSSQPLSPRTVPISDTSATGMDDESDKGGLADVDTDSDAEITGQLLNRLADISLNADSEGEDERQPERGDPIVLVTPKLRTTTGPVPRAPHANKLLTGSNPGPTAVSDPDIKATKHSLPTSTMAPTVPIAALRIVKKAQPMSRTESHARSMTSYNSESAPKPTTARVTSPSESATSSRPSTTSASLPHRGSSLAKTSATGLSARPSTASILKYGPSSNRAASAKRGETTSEQLPTAASRSSTASMYGTQSRLKRSSSVTTNTAIPGKSLAAPKFSGIRPPSRFSASSTMTAPSGNTNRTRLPAPSKAATTPMPQPTRDIARILRGPERQRTISKRV